MRLFFCLLGLVLMVEGIPYFALPHKMKKWILAIQGLPDSHLRVMGFPAMVLGLVVTYLFNE